MTQKNLEGVHFLTQEQYAALADRPQEDIFAVKMDPIDVAFLTLVMVKDDNTSQNVDFLVRA